MNFRLCCSILCDVVSSDCGSLHSTVGDFVQMKFVTVALLSNSCFNEVNLEGLDNSWLITSMDDCFEFELEVALWESCSFEVFVVLVGYFNSQVSTVSIELDDACEWVADGVLEFLGKDDWINICARTVIDTDLV
jgi:hypothetical protein